MNSTGETCTEPLAECAGVIAVWICAFAAGIDRRLAGRVPEMSPAHESMHSLKPEITNYATRKRMYIYVYVEYPSKCA